MPLGPISQQVAQGAPASVKSIPKLAFGGRFPAGGPGKPRQPTNLYEKCPLELISQQMAQGAPASAKSIPKLASGGRFPAGGPGKPRQRTNLYENWPLEGISQQMAQRAPSIVFSMHDTTIPELAHNVEEGRTNYLHVLE